MGLEVGFSFIRDEEKFNTHIDKLRQFNHASPDSEEEFDSKSSGLMDLAYFGRCYTIDNIRNQFSKEIKISEYEDIYYEVDHE